MTLGSDLQARPARLAGAAKVLSDGPNAAVFAERRQFCCAGKAKSAMHPHNTAANEHSWGPAQETLPRMPRILPWQAAALGQANQRER